MTAIDYLNATYGAELKQARANYRDCRRKGLRVMTEFYRRDMVRLYMQLRNLRGRK